VLVSNVDGSNTIKVTTTPLAGINKLCPLQLRPGCRRRRLHLEGGGLAHAREDKSLPAISQP
jgi:hypothetical protein